jgi:hypothetical protein
MTLPFVFFHIYFHFKVLASQTKIYIILEFVTGGELFDKIVRFLLSLCTWATAKSICLFGCLANLKQDDFCVTKILMRPLIC